MGFFGLPPNGVASSLQSLKGINRSSGFAAWNPYTIDRFDTFQNYSINHGSGAHRGNPRVDVGGPWWMERTRHELHPIAINENTLQGPAISGFVTGWAFANTVDITEGQLRALGTKALSLASPNNPSVSLPQIIGELKKDGLPKMGGTELWKEKSNFLKGSSSEYLNLEFGWKPLINDVRRFANTVTNHKKIMDGYIRDSGHQIRRRYVFPPEQRDFSKAGSVIIIPSASTRFADGSTSASEVKQTWFSGAFKYHIPIGVSQGDTMARHYAEAKKLLGVRLTPDTLWNLAPWTWATDWFANTGDIVTNVSNLGSDGLAMRYGYVMTSRKKEISTGFTYGQQYGWHRVTEERKIRMPASPYGFDTTFDGLSTRQKAICAALGITRVR